MSNKRHKLVKTAVETSPAQSLASQMFAEAVNRHKLGEFPVAEALYRAIVALQVVHAETYYNLGLILQTQGRLEEAMVVYRNAILIRPDYVDAYSNLGTALQDLRRFDEAITAYRQAIAIKPDFAMAHCNLGVALKEAGHLDESVSAYQRAIKIKPDYDWAYANLSAVLQELARFEESVVACKKALAITPTMHTAYFNLGTGYKALCQLDEAADAYRSAIALKPDFVEAHFSLSHVLLLAGNLTEGWPEYDWRWRLADYSWLRNIHGEFHQPVWEGEELGGKTILVYAEQGLGDAIQFCRYLPALVKKGGPIVLAVHPPLKKLLGAIPGVTVVTLDQPPLPHFDVHCPLLSLPRAFGTTLDTIPAESPYLQADPVLIEKWRGRLDGKNLKVGIVWAGNPSQKGDKFRSPRLAAVSPLFDVPGVDFVTLQVGAGRNDIADYPLPSDVLDLGAEITDFADTAAIMMNLDLVITSCTAPLHLAGALGVPTWAVIPFSPHYPWLLNRADNPWYPSLRLYRQDKPGSHWATIIERVGVDLAALARDKP